MRIPVFMALLITAPALAAAQQGTYWDYLGKTGPLNWGKLDPAWRACSEGKEQSPIDIRGAHLNKTLPPIEFHYIAAGATLENNGKGILVTPHPGSYIIAQGVRYDLQEFDFHHPSEEAVHGKLDDMDVHLVHKSADGKIAIVAVRLREDPNNANAVLSTLWSKMPDQAGQKAEISMVNAGGLLPGDRGYWTYMGSLSTPACTEGVRWYVMEQDIPISREQLRQFAALYRLNSRALQDPHGRRIEANE